MSDGQNAGTPRSAEWEAHLNVTAVGVLPWPTETPVAAHMDTEGINR